MLDAPALPTPAIVAPAPREVSFGLVSGLAPRGTARLVVSVGGRVLADRPLRGRSFSLRVDLPVRQATVRVIAVDGVGRRSSSAVPEVYGLPRTSRNRASATREDPRLARAVDALARTFSGTSGIYVQDLASGRGAAWNARARFPAASTLKLAIAVAVLRAHQGKPEPGSRLAGLLRKMLVDSDNRAANELEVWLGGSTGVGSGRVNETMAALGLSDSDMYGGYEVTRRPQGPIPVRVDAQPLFPRGKYTSASDLARLLRAIDLAAHGKGALLRLGVNGGEARHLLWLLAQVGDRAKLGRYLDGAVPVLHKAGWLPQVRHDAGLVLWPGGGLVAVVLAHRTAGVGTSADVLAGKVALAALRRFATRR